MTDGAAMDRARGRLGHVLRGKYRLDAVLGVGGMAVVYAATHRNKKRFAIKMLHAELSLNTDVRTRFLREGYVANSVEHPGAVSVLDDDIAEDGAAFVVMELLDGLAIDELVATHGGRVPVPLALSIIDALLEVMSAAHRKKIVHRDIKPANLFLTKDGRLHVLDFGIARLRDDAGGEATATGAMLGTPAFMAPEQALGHASDIDAQTDLWAIGATFFFLLSGELVHPGENAAQLLIKAATKKARTIAGVMPTLHAAIANLVDRALAFDKAERWESADEMRDALHKASREATDGVVQALPKDVARPLEANITGLEDTAAVSPVADTDEAAFAPTAVEEAPATATVPAPTPASARTDAPVDRKGRNRLVIAGALVAAVAGGIAVASLLAPAKTTPAVSTAPSGSATPRQGRSPATPAAVAAYEAAMEAWRNGQREESLRSLLAVVDADPGFGPGYLRLAIHWCGPGADDETARVFFQKALQHRASLGELDEALLAAFEPRLLLPPDRGEYLRRMEAAAPRFKTDAYFQNLLGEALIASRPDDADAAFQRALAADPRNAPAYEVRIAIARTKGDNRVAAELVDACVNASASAIGCLGTRMSMAAAEGRCQDVKADANRLLAIDATTDDHYWAVAMGMEAVGDPMDAVGEVLKRGATRVSDPDIRRLRELDALWTVSVHEGDFFAAAKNGDEAIAQSSRTGRVEKGGNLQHHRAATADEDEIALALEAGDIARARALVKALRTRVTATSLDDQDVARVLPLLAAWELQVGSRSHEQLVVERDRLVDLVRKNALEKTGRDDPFGAWRVVHAATASDERGALEALAAMPPLDEASERALQRNTIALDVGRVYALAGRGKDALPLLERATRTCFRLGPLIDNVQALYWLGLAREQNGDRKGAREAYEKLLGRWGKATPRSVTAEKARGRLAALDKSSSN
jgi:serine/threonine-protein kinase